MKTLKIGIQIFSTSQTLIGTVEKINEQTIDVRCETWTAWKNKSTGVTGKNILVRFDKSYLKENNGKIEMFQKSPEDKEVWGKILKG